MRWGSLFLVFQGPSFALSTEHVPYASFPFTCVRVVSSYPGSELFPRILAQESQKSPSPADCFPLYKSMCPFPVQAVPLFAHKTVPVAHWDISALPWAPPQGLVRTWEVLGRPLFYLDIYKHLSAWMWLAMCRNSRGPSVFMGFFLSLECGMIWVSLRSSLACETYLGFVLAEQSCCTLGCWWSTLGLGAQISNSFNISFSR